jgi:hypothetical protein
MRQELLFEIENERIRLLQKSKKMKKKVDNVKGGVKIPQAYRNLKARSDRPKWQAAMDVEWKAFKDKKVMVPILRSEAKGKNIVSVRWVYDIKEKCGDIQYAYDNNHSLIQTAYNERGWDHNNNIPVLPITVEGEIDSQTLATEIDKKINVMNVKWVYDIKICELISQ